MSNKKSKRRLQFITLPCGTGKMSFWSLEEAQAEADRLNAVNRLKSPIPAEAYKCRCNLWHVGRPKPKDTDREHFGQVD